MTRYPFPGLTKAQRSAFEQIAAGNDRGHNPKTLAVLLDRGLIVHCGDEVLGRDRFGAVTVPSYEVPRHHHAAWCLWCSKQPSSPGQGDVMRNRSTSDRLALSRAEAGALYEDGYRAGQIWLQTSATPEEISGMDLCWPYLGDSCVVLFEEDAVPGQRGGAEHLHGFLRQKEEGEAAVAAFWRSALSEADRGKERFGAFVVGFAEAVLQAWFDMVEDGDEDAEGGT